MIFKSNKFRNSINDLTGRRFGKLVVVSFYGSAVSRNGKSLGTAWQCLCDCGKSAIATRSSLVTSDKKSCGCLPGEHGKKVGNSMLRHGHCRSLRRSKNSSTYQTWCSMKRRCADPNAAGYKNYGGRGISVCERWRNSFENFLLDMGEKIAGMSIERIDVNGDYEPLNCKWIPRFEQAKNKRRPGDSFLIEIGGETKSLIAWCAENRIPAKTAFKRIRFGWSPQDAVSTPVRKKAPNGYKSTIVHQ